MTHEQIKQALYALKPNAEWTLKGDTLSGLDWVDTFQTRPTDTEITTKIEELFPVED